MKVRLYRGPFNGKVMENPQNGAQDIKVRGPKPMTRRQRYEWERKQWTDRTARHYLDPFAAKLPIVMACYKLCVRTVPNSNGGLVSIPLVHPDGSYFYEWDGQKPIEC